MSMQTIARVDIVNVKYCNGDVNRIAELVNQEIAECENEAWELRGVPQYFANEYAVWLTFEKKVQITDDSDNA